MKIYIYIQRALLLKMVEIHTIHDLCKGIKILDEKNRHYYVKEIRQLLSKDIPPIDEVVQAGIIPHLIDFLKLRDIPLIFEPS